MSRQGVIFHLQPQPSDGEEGQRGARCTKEYTLGRKKLASFPHLDDQKKEKERKITGGARGSGTRKETLPVRRSLRSLNHL